MQTFVPSSESFDQCAVLLDYRRLGKQRVESRQILDALEGRKSGWVNHPAVKMWRGYEVALIAYSNCMIREWKRRGYNNTMEIIDISGRTLIMPEWWGGPIHSTHRSALLLKDPDFYSQYGWTEKAENNYHWPKGAR